jgi:hypothetical protein
MPDEVAGIPRIAVERSHRDLPRRDGQQPGNRRKPPRPAQDVTPSPAGGDDPPAVGSRLNVHA